MPRNSPLASPSATWLALEQLGLHTKKALGQHFLVNDNTVGRILHLADLLADQNILEIGPGIGTLTLALLQQDCKVLAVEKDAALAEALENIKREYPATFDYRIADAVELLEGYPGARNPQLDSNQEHNSLLMLEALSASLKLVANLPYAVAATIVLAAFAKLEQLESATVMVQREVAQRMQAVAGSKDYGAYTVKLQTLVKPMGYFVVSPGNFLPAPRVDSAVIRLDRRDSQSLNTSLIEQIFMVANAAFFQRRKTIRNSMRAYFLANRTLLQAQLGTSECMTDAAVTTLVDELLANAKVSPGSRGEQHDVPTYRKLGELLSSCSSK
jgi:16S rRNA (adenine1518-N6/adenine1519-N6)-dimethyltransferase